MTDGRVPSTAREQLLQALVEHLADHGVRDQSLRTLAAAVGTSHRMLLYHFGSREGLLAAVVDAVERQQRQVLDRLAESTRATPREAALEFWSLVLAPALRYGPLFFELSAHAMRSQPHAVVLRDSLVEPWLHQLTGLLRRAGHRPETARVRARLGLAVARGLLHDVLLSGDTAGVDAAMALFVDLVEPGPG
ncbi:TetR family transcriptional regulator [Micromonospora sp. WMMD1102]|uniref:TetR/AcrR family transcriptional regulator n=1 Tax=Micromonospora sp. WMMD1102 TaxID=3016105 RepID=UPI002414EF52|nr:TetR family transcriptional regulator [Micromonospora sp. WMMD1102]MDG4788627.1 TetR family transcriptional regulator [Micromonospora sp. WMMD1102]